MKPRSPAITLSLQAAGVPLCGLVSRSGGRAESRKSCCWVAELIDPASGVGDTFDGIFCKVHHGQQRLVLPLIELELAPENRQLRPRRKLLVLVLALAVKIGRHSSRSDVMTVAVGFNPRKTCRPTSFFVA